MILDQSVFFGVADIHDRHRDMRLDVDNMSYEVNSSHKVRERERDFLLVLIEYSIKQWLCVI